MSKSMELTEAILLSLLPNVLTKRGSVTPGSDLDDYTQTGFYMMDIKSAETVGNLPPGYPRNGLLIVLNHYCLVQIIIPGYSGSPIIHRSKWYNQVFREWYELASTKIVTTT